MFSKRKQSYHDGHKTVKLEPVLVSENAREKNKYKVLFTFVILCNRSRLDFSLYSLSKQQKHHFVSSPAIEIKTKRYTYDLKSGSHLPKEIVLFASMKVL